MQPASGSTTDVSVGAAVAASRRTPRSERPGRRPIRLFWRILIPNAAVLGTASAVLIIAPPNGRPLVILGGLASMLAINVVLMRRTFAPLERLSSLMQRVDPLRPGERVPLEGAQSEVSMLAETFNAMLDRLEDERRDSGRRAMIAQEAERRRVANELHDEIGQSLTALILQLKRTVESGPPDRELVVSAEAILAEVRAVARRLRPEALDDLGLRSALLALAARMDDAAGVDVAVRIDPRLPSLAHDVELVIYRVVQESLTNVVRHAGAEHARVELRQDEGGVVLGVSDDGGGFDVSARHRGEGLRGMRERALLVGGALTVDSRPGAGTRVRLIVP
jgi:two-component system sensor histidine kinase UhpB